MRSYIIKENPISSTISWILWYRQTDTHIHILLLFIRRLLLDLIGHADHCFDLLSLRQSLSIFHSSRKCSQGFLLYGSCILYIFQRFPVFLKKYKLLKSTNESYHQRDKSVIDNKDEKSKSLIH